MTPVEFAANARFMTRTTSATFLDADIVRLMKIRQDEIAKAILKSDENILLIPQYTSLVALQREYSLPSDMLASIKRVEAKLDGTNFVELTEFDVGSYGRTINVEDEITLNFGNGVNEAKFSLSRKSLTIYSGTITSVINGLKILVNTWPAPITDLTDTTDMSSDPSTTTHGIPREMHEIWNRGVVIDWKSSREKPIPLSERELKYEVDKQEAIKSLMPQNRDRDIYQTVPPASDRGNDGTNY